MTWRDCETGGYSAGGRRAMRAMAIRWLGVIVCACLGAACVPTAAAQFDVIASSGDASPDGNGNLLTFTSPALGDGGHVAFLSTLVGTAGGGADNMALFRGNTSGLSVILRRGDEISETETAGNFINNLPAVNSGGLVMHTVAAEGMSTENVSFLGSGGELIILPRVGTPSPDGDNGLVTKSIPVLNNAGLTGFRARFNGVNPESGIYTQSDGTLTALLQVGDEAPAGGTILSVANSFPTVNNSGQVALTASVDTGVFTYKAALRVDSMGLVEYARGGDMTVDGMTTLSNILSNAVLINDVGQTAFVASYTQEGVSQRQGIFRADASGATLLTINPFPESPNLATNLNVHGLSDGGRVAFSADLSGGSDPTAAVYSAGGGTPSLIALEDTLTMPGSDKYFRNIDIRSISMNGDGQMAFLADLSDSADGPFSGRGLYFYDPLGGLQEVLRTGDMFEGSTILSLGLTGTDHTVDLPLNEMQSPHLNFSGLNNAGQVGFLFTLATGVSGVAVWTAAEPEVIPGDYNGNGIVDAADYSVWRDHLGQSYTLSGENPAATTPGEVDQEDYDFWVSRFGATTPGGASVSVSQATVPEPAAAALLLVAAFLCSPLRATRRGNRSSLNSQPASGRIAD